MDSKAQPVIQVLLSAYNGDRHLREQIESILAQVGVRVLLRVRDDGSTDATASILREYCDDERVQVVRGRNLGLPRAFFHLIEGSSDDVDFWALADQDDVWLPDKLARATFFLSDVRGPGLYCSRVCVVDEWRRPLYLHPLPRRGPSFANALVQNMATGCTVVLNEAARDMARRRWPSYAVMHDAWLYLVIAATGEVIYDAHVGVEYRQHSSNSVGMGADRRARLARRLRRQFSPGASGAHGRQNTELARTHGDVLSPRASAELFAFLASRRSAWARTCYALRGHAHRQTVGSNQILKVLHVLGRV
jgi:glycosyltransferase involved in cell wall biosynthesis